MRWTLQKQSKSDGDTSIMTRQRDCSVKELELYRSWSIQKKVKQEQSKLLMRCGQTLLVLGYQNLGQFATSDMLQWSETTEYTADNRISQKKAMLSCISETLSVLLKELDETLRLDEIYSPTDRQTLTTWLGSPAPSDIPRECPYHRGIMAKASCERLLSSLHKADPPAIV